MGVVQFVGPPGSGKTTLIRQTAAEHGLDVVDLAHTRNLDGRQVPTSRRRLVWAASAARNPGLAARLLPRVDRRHAIVRQAFEAIRRDRLMRRLARREGVWLVDEGPLHPLLWSLAVSGWDGDPAPIGRRLCAPSVVVAVRTPVEVAAGRILHEGRRSMRGMGRAEVVGAMGRYWTLADRMLAAMPARVTDGVAALREVGRY